MNNEDLIRIIKEKAQLYDIVSRNVRLQKSGNGWLGLCPFHKEKTPSFRVDERGFHCFGCGEHGDVITFIQKTENISFREAIKHLANMYNVPLPSENIALENPSKAVYNALEVINRYFIQQLQSNSGAVAREYLSSRNITKDSIEKFQLGFAPDNNELSRVLNKQGISDDLLVRTGVFVKSKYSGKIVNRYAGRLIFPIFDSYSRCAGFGGRTIGKSNLVKYINSPETEVFSKHDLLYGYSIARHSKSKQIVIVEGYLDVIAMHQAGFDGTIAPLGTAISKSQISLCWRICDFPIISLDGDNAGITAAYRWIDRIFESLVPGKSFKFAKLPEGTDPDILLSSGQRQILENTLENAIPLAQWLWDGAFALNPVDTPEQKAAIVKKIFEKINLIQDESIRRLYYQEMKNSEREMYRSKFKKIPNVRSDIKVAPIVSVQEKFEKIFVVTIVNHPYMIDRVIEDFVKLEMQGSKTKELQRKIIDFYELIARDKEEYVRKMHSLKDEVKVMESEVVLHAKFTSESSSDEVAFEGWSNAMNSFLAQPNLARDLQNAASSLECSFSEDDWQRLKALKKEDIFVKQKWKM